LKSTRTLQHRDGVQGGKTLCLPRSRYIGFAEGIIHELAKLYKSNDPEPLNLGKPRKLTLFFGVDQSHPFRRRMTICHTVRYTELSPDRFKGFWKD
jgi:hypothetical protein